MSGCGTIPPPDSPHPSRPAGNVELFPTRQPGRNSLVGTTCGGSGCGSGVPCWPRVRGCGWGDPDRPSRGGAGGIVQSAKRCGKGLSNPIDQSATRRRQGLRNRFRGFAFAIRPVRAPRLTGIRFRGSLWRLLAGKGEAGWGVTVAPRCGKAQKNPTPVKGWGWYGSGVKRPADRKRGPSDRHRSRGGPTRNGPRHGNGHQRRGWCGRGRHTRSQR